MGALRVFEHELVAYRREWRGTLFTSFLSPLLYLAAMGVGLGSLVDEGAVGADVSYLVWLAPALMAATAMQTGAFEATWPVVAGFQWLRIFEAAITTPTRPRDLVRGRALWAAFRLTIVAGVFGLVASLLGAMTLIGAVAIVPVAVLTGVSTSLAVTAFTSRMESSSQVAGIFRYVVVPMFLFSGTFFPVSQLPEPLQPFAWATPLWHGVELSRSASLDVALPVPALVHIAVLAGIGFLGYVLSVRQFERRLIA